MPHWKIWAALVALLLALPYALLMTAGGLWLYEQRLWPYFLAITAVAMLVGSLLARGFRRVKPLKSAARMDPSPTWPPAGEAAWRDVQAIAARVQHENLPFDVPQRWLPVLREVIDTVARHFFPRSRDPWLEVSVPDALRIIELVAGDLRQTLLQQVPGSHMFSIHDLEWVKKLAGLWQQLYFGYRLLSLGLNPVAAAVREIRSAATGQVVSYSVDEVQRWATDFCVRKAGYYAIQLYSGQLSVEDDRFRSFVSPQSREDAGEASERSEKLVTEPLRMLVLGQTNAGKSSLTNALFGEMRAATDVVPRTRGVDPYLLERDGLPSAIILDTAGYGGSDDGDPDVNAALLPTDLILLVCSAQSAARDADRRLLDDVRARFEVASHRSLPPVVVALTHIDGLRPFNEWRPPYNIAAPDSPKAETIAAAVTTVAEDLQLPVERVVPVCLLPERLYNVDEGIIPAMLASLPAAERAKLLRALKQYHDEQYWQLLAQQAKNTGRLIFSAGADWAHRKANELADRFLRKN
jgi:predicted GTPase